MSESESMKIEIDFSGESSQSLNAMFGLAYVRSPLHCQYSSHKRSINISYRNDAFLNLLSEYDNNYSYSDVLNVCLDASIDIFRYLLEFCSDPPPASVSEHEPNTSLAGELIDSKVFFAQLAKKYYDRLSFENPYLAETLKELNSDA